MTHVADDRRMGKTESREGRTGDPWCTFGRDAFTRVELLFLSPAEMRIFTYARPYVVITPLCFILKSNFTCYAEYLFKNICVHFYFKLNWKFFQYIIF